MYCLYLYLCKYAQLYSISNLYTYTFEIRLLRTV